jgi:signal transduction histidine kinase
MFYGYFAQIERIKRVAHEKEAEARRQQKVTAEIRRQRERLEVLHDVNVAVTSTIDRSRILDVFLDKALLHLPYAIALVRLRNQETGLFETTASKGIATADLGASSEFLAFADEILKDRVPLTISDLFTDPRIKHAELFRKEGLVSFLGLPLIANGEGLGSLVFLTRQEHDFPSEEKGFLSTLAGHLAIAIHHSQLFKQIHEQANELRHANQVKDEFLGVVSHELKTPLNVIAGYSSMLLEGMLGEISPIQEKALQTVSRQSRELHNLINSVLQVSSIEAEMLPVELQEINFWEFLCELRAVYEYPLAKEVRIVWEAPADLPTVYADRGKVRHILENLINNAIKFTDHGTVTISARYLTNKKIMELKVADTGIGIPKDLLPTVFDRFRQADSSDTRAHGGVGLGLYIVKKYTNLLGGTVQVESRVGHGSTFTVRVPCQSPKPTFAHQQLSLLSQGEATGRSVA